jgi:phosphatidylglycerol:prolipoprotein diacylglycerol transferase
MRPILLEWYGIRVYSYPAMLYLGLVFGIVAGNYAANVAGLASDRVFVAMLLLAVAGLIGARLLFVSTHWAIYRREPGRIWRRSEGGAAMQGGLLLAMLVSAPLLWAVGLPFGAFWDVATFTALIWVVFARIGCLLHGCCGGRPSDGRFALNLPNSRGIWCPRVPTQILEGGWAALLLLGAVRGWVHSAFPGALFLAAVAAYEAGRFVLQPTREVQQRIEWLNLPRALSAALVTGSVTSLLILWLGLGGTR